MLMLFESICDFCRVEKDVKTIRGGAEASMKFYGNCALLLQRVPVQQSCGVVDGYQTTGVLMLRGLCSIQTDPTYHVTIPRLRIFT